METNRIENHTERVWFNILYSSAITEEKLLDKFDDYLIFKRHVYKKTKRELLIKRILDSYPQDECLKRWVWEKSLEIYKPKYYIKIKVLGRRPSSMETDCELTFDHNHDGSIYPEGCMSKLFTNCKLPYNPKLLNRIEQLHHYIEDNIVKEMLRDDFDLTFVGRMQVKCRIVYAMLFKRLPENVARTWYNWLLLFLNYRLNLARDWYSRKIKLTLPFPEIPLDEIPF